MSIHIGPKEFEEVFNDSLSDYVVEKIKEYDFHYEEIDLQTRDHYLKMMIEALLSDKIVISGEHRLKDWESGWRENFELLSDNLSYESLIPKYIAKYPVTRWRQNLIQPVSPHFEYNMLKIIQDWLFDKYARHVSSIFEFGCGTGHNLIRLRELNPTAKLWGLDWATSSQEIIEKYATYHHDSQLKGIRFNYFQPDYNVPIDEDSLVYTVASLEQIGDKFQPFIEFMLNKKPKYCIHIEPIAELLDPEHLLDYLSIGYIHKRNYLKNFYTYLKQLEEKNMIEILLAQRSYIGSLFIEGYSVLIWKPVTSS